MIGLLNLASGFADGMLGALPALCYISAGSCFLFSAWTMLSMAKHANHPHSLRPWVPLASLLFSGLFASFPRFLQELLATAGSPMTVSVLTTYVPTLATVVPSVVGATPADTVVNVVVLFQRFFQGFGALCVYFAVLHYRSIINAKSNGSSLACLVQVAAGVLCINIVAVATAFVALFPPP